MRGKSLAVGCVLLAIVPVRHAFAQGLPAGAYRARTATLELKADGQVIFGGAGGPLIIGSYLVQVDTIVFRDESGVAACPGETGRYTWRLAADTLRFQPLTDACTTRRSALALAWTRGGATTTFAAPTLNAVLITAQRQTEDLQRAPLAMSVVSSETIRDANVTRTQDLTYLAPGLQIGSLIGSTAVLYMRGVGNFAGNSLQDPTVTVNFDGVYIARQTATNGLLYDLDRVEVLKGPQGTLYGRNATGGAINIVPQRPRLRVREGVLNVGVGAFNSQQLDGAFNVPLGKRAALRLAAQRVRHDGYMNDGTDDQNDWAGRIAGRFEVNDRLAVRAVADYFQQGGRGNSSTPLALGVENRIGVTSPEGGAYYLTQRHSLAGRSFAPTPANQYVDNQHSGVHTTVDWRNALGALTVTAAARRSVLDQRGSPSGNIVTQQEHSTQKSVEARLSAAPMQRLDLLVGTFLFDESIAVRGDALFRVYNQYNVSLQKPESGVTSAAAFGRLTLHVSDRLRATVGARYTHERKTFGGSFQTFNRICVPPPTGQCPNAQPFPVDLSSAPLTFPTDSLSATPVFNPADGTRTVGFRILSNTAATFDRTTWRAALEYDLAPQTFVYSSYETGFKSGGFFFSNDDNVYQPETVGALTVGFKSRRFENRLQANLELFDWRYRDQQVSKISVDSRNVTNLRTENIGQATIRGAEAGLEIVPFFETPITATVQYLKATYDSYRYQTPLSSGPPVSGCAVSSKTTGFLVDCTGRQSPYAPEWTIALGASREFALPSNTTLTARTRARYQSRTLLGLDFLPQQQQAGYWIADASLTYATARERLFVTLFGQNLTDETVLSNSFVVPFSTFAIGVLRPPRTLGVRLGTHF